MAIGLLNFILIDEELHWVGSYVSGETICLKKTVMKLNGAHLFNVFECSITILNLFDKQLSMA